jgi:hypothetical protein
LERHLFNGVPSARRFLIWRVASSSGAPFSYVRRAFLVRTPFSHAAHHPSSGAPFPYPNQVFGL